MNDNLSLLQPILSEALTSAGAKPIWGLRPPESFPQPHPAAGKIRIHFIFAWLVVGGEETEVRLLAKHLPKDRYLIEVTPCFRKDGMSDQSYDQLRALGVSVDTTAYDLSFDDTVDYLRRKLSGADIVVSCQNVADIYPALEQMRLRPPLIEHGGLVSEALAGPKHFTSRYIGVCDTIREVAASRMPDRPQHAVQIPSMVDLAPFAQVNRQGMRLALKLRDDEVLIGWVGRLDRKKRVEDFIRAAAQVVQTRPNARFVVVGGPDAFMPEYAAELRQLATTLDLAKHLIFTGDHSDMAQLFSAMDIFCWLSRGEGMPHVIAEAGAARLAVIATPDNGVLQQIQPDWSGLFVPHETPAAVAQAMLRLIDDPRLRHRLGQNLHQHVAQTYAVELVVPQWQHLFEQVLAEIPAAPPAQTFSSFVLGGWESSTHRLANGQRLDLLAATGHDQHTAQDYQQLASLGITAGRDAVRWHLVEPRTGQFDLSTVTPMMTAARDTGTQIVWDLLHYGWPDDLDIWHPTFVARFARFARAIALHHREISDAIPFWCPVNEISFFAWAGGDARYLNPFGAGRGFELKCQLARASMAAIDQLREVDPRARIVHAEPLIAVHHAKDKQHPLWEAQGWHDAQFQALDLLSGRLWPQLGGNSSYLDIIGANYYGNNQWIHGGPPIDVDHPQYRPLSDLMFELAARYDRPLMIAETGTEGARRGLWFDYIQTEVTKARKRGVPIEGICLYPIANHPGWDNDRICPNGLLGHIPEVRGRSVHSALAQRIAISRPALSPKIAGSS